jgi:hypothetical protein
MIDMLHRRGLLASTKEPRSLAVAGLKRHWRSIRDPPA